MQKWSVLKKNDTKVKPKIYEIFDTVCAIIKIKTSKIKKNTFLVETHNSLVRTYEHIKRHLS